jgi:hypothetical protein
MKHLAEGRLVDALAEWGAHEAQTRYGRSPSADRLNHVELALRSRAPMVARILAATPLGCARVEVTADDVPALIITDGRSLEAWTDAVLLDQGRSGADVRAMVAGAAAVAGPMICTATLPEGSDTMEPPLIIFDGWHRGAAWLEHGRRGHRYPIGAYLILTRRQASLLGEPIGWS